MFTNFVCYNAISVCPDPFSDKFDTKNETKWSHNIYIDIDTSLGFLLKNISRNCFNPQDFFQNRASKVNLKD